MHDKDAWGCGFCASLLTTWEERCEHIALHFEEKGSSKWNFTNVVLGLMKQDEVSHAWNQMMLQRHGDELNWPTLLLLKALGDRLGVVRRHGGHVGIKATEGTHSSSRAHVILSNVRADRPLCLFQGLMLHGLRRLHWIYIHHSVLGWQSVGALQPLVGPII